MAHRVFTQAKSFVKFTVKSITSSRIRTTPTRMHDVYLQLADDVVLHTVIANVP